MINKNQAHAYGTIGIKYIWIKILSYLKEKYIYKFKTINKSFYHKISNEITSIRETFEYLYNNELFLSFEKRKKPSEVNCHILL